MASLTNFLSRIGTAQVNILPVLLCAVVNLVVGAKDPVMSSAIECARECVEGEAPKICHYKFTLEEYSVLGLACNLCTPSASDQLLETCQCVTADGIERMILTANRMLPGPRIQVCRNDKVVVDVKNTIPGQEVTIHWHGILQRGTPYFDGVPMVTQCAIPEGSTFRYQWKAEDVGTHYWHSHSGPQRMDGLHGPIIIRQPKSLDVHGALYDVDLPSVILLADWFHHLSGDKYPGPVKNNPGQTAENLLINGKGIYIDPKKKNETKTPMEIFQVEPGKRHRFRFINSMSSVCASILTIEGHRLQLIETDGNPVEPVMIDSIISVSGERYDFILNANQTIKSYWIHVRGLEECESTEAQQFAIIQYKGSKISSASKRPEFKKPLKAGMILNDYERPCKKQNSICISQLNSKKKLDKKLLPSSEPDLKIYMPFDVFQFKLDELFLPNKSLIRYLIAPIPMPFGSTVNHLTYKEASSPLISQYGDIDPNEICNVTKKPDRCKARCIPNSEIKGGPPVCVKGEKCSCTHVRDIPLNSVVEIILVDYVAMTARLLNIPKLIHPFHLHGYEFLVMAMGDGHDINATEITAEYAMKADAEGRLVRNLNNPPLKDTIAVPSNGYAVIKFRADNPGFWLFHCHFQLHMTIGMAQVLHVGQQSDLPPVPEGFPKCGNFEPKITAR